MTDINRALAEDAAEEYAPLDKSAQRFFAFGWLAYCDGEAYREVRYSDARHWQNGYIAARDAPE